VGPGNSESGDGRNGTDAAGACVTGTTTHQSLLERLIPTAAGDGPTPRPATTPRIDGTETGRWAGVGDGFQWLMDCHVSVVYDDTKSAISESAVVTPQLGNRLPIFMDKTTRVARRPDETLR